MCDICYATVKNDFVTALMYDAAFAWAHAANKTLEQGIYPTQSDMRRFGGNVAYHMRNLEFDGKFLRTYYMVLQAYNPEYSIVLAVKIGNG